MLTKSYTKHSLRNSVMMQIALATAIVLFFSSVLLLAPTNASAATINILEPQTGWKTNNTLHVRANVAGAQVAKVEVYYARGTQSYPAQPQGVQHALTGRTDYFFSIDLTSTPNTTVGKVRVVAKNSSNQVLASQEVTGLTKTNTSTSLPSLKDGAHVLKDANGNTIGTRFVLWSKHAHKAQVWIYGYSDTGENAPNKVVELVKQSSVVLDGHYWVADVLHDPSMSYGHELHYGFRVWGPNWPYHAEWRPGTVLGFIQDVDAQGNRYNPNKLLIDPYARTISKDPDWSMACFTSGDCRAEDTAGAIGKSIVYDPSTYNWSGDVPVNIPYEDTIFYEVHVRGFTQHNSSGVANRGTFKGFTEKLPHLVDLGVTSIEFLPIQETENDKNDSEPHRANYWGYWTINFFSPDRRYSSDKSPVGPIHEFKDTVKSLHQHGFEVILDIVNNHTAEGTTWNNDPNKATILSFRGIDNQVYYSLTADRQRFEDNSCCGNFNVVSPKGEQFVIDTLRYWVDEMRVDGFRHDLAAILGNTVEHGGFWYDKMQSRLLNRIINEFPTTKMVAEPWGVGGNSYQVGNFPGSYDAGQANVWSEWNDLFKNTVRQVVRSDAGQIPDLATRLAGSSDLFGNDGRRPFNSINKVTAHDGMTMNDLVTYNQKQNNQSWPYGPSDGGIDDDKSWDSGGDETLRRQQIRNLATHLMLSAGTPIILGGDEMRRTQRGNNNAYNLDTVASWYDWNWMNQHSGTYNYFKGIIDLRKNHQAFKRKSFYTGQDHDGDGIPDIQWHGVNYLQPDWSNASRTLALRIQGSAAETGYATNDHDFFIIANHYWSGLNFQLPPNHPGHRWYRVIDTASWAEAFSNVKSVANADLITDGSWTNTYAQHFAGNHTYNYWVHPRSMVVFVQKPYTP